MIRGSQWQLEVNASNRPVARENASDQGAISFSLHLIGWEGGASFLARPIKQHSKAKPIQSWITFNTQLKIALTIKPVRPVKSPKIAHD